MPQPEKLLDPTRSPEAWFGAELRLRRKAAGFVTARALAVEVQVSVDMILKIEKGQYRCPEDLAPRLDAVLGTGGLFERAWAMAFDADKRRRDADTSTATVSDRLGHTLEGPILEGRTSSAATRSESVHRRAFLAIGGLAALAPLDLTRVLSPGGELTAPAKVSPREIHQLLDIANSLQTWDNTYGGGGLVSELAANSMRWAVTLLSVDCPSGIRPDFLAAVARLGLVAGASKFDTCDHPSAQTAFRIAVECAEEGKHWHLRAKGYSLLARQAVWIGEPDDGLTFAEKGLVRSDRLTATERAMLHTARARALARMHNVPEATAAVGAADEAFAARRPQDDPPWMTYYDEAQHNGDTAHALFDLAIGSKAYDPAQAEQRFRTAVNGHGQAFPRSRAISATKLASLAMHRGDPYEGVLLGREAVALSGVLTSRRAASDLLELGQFAANHPWLPEAVDLHSLVAATVQE
ncbi:helix-turn-helix domain-containing protein [Kitasatospora purpeofusca]|uniref:helix-turn-helix domain-containing protein n=1 Tax=Kitasatospora purpeofusca TaxID=67352 RepID=UPI003674B3EF